MHFVPKKMYKWGKIIWNHSYLVLPTCLKNSPRWRLRCNGLAGGRGGGLHSKIPVLIYYRHFPSENRTAGVTWKIPAPLPESQPPEGEKKRILVFLMVFFHLYASQIGHFFRYCGVIEVPQKEHEKRNRKIKILILRHLQNDALPLWNSKNTCVPMYGIKSTFWPYFYE